MKEAERKRDRTIEQEVLKEAEKARQRKEELKAEQADIMRQQKWRESEERVRKMKIEEAGVLQRKSRAESQRRLAEETAKAENEARERAEWETQKANVLREQKSEEERDGPKKITDFSGVYDDTPHWTDTVITQSGNLIHVKPGPRNYISSFTATVDGNVATTKDGGTMSWADNLITWPDGNTWEKRQAAPSVGARPTDNLKPKQGPAGGCAHNHGIRADVAKLS